MRDVPRDDIFKLGAAAAAAAAAGEFCEWIHFLRLYQKDKSSGSIVKFRQASNCYKRILEAAKLAYANKTKECITFQKRGSWDFWQVANSVLNLAL